MTIRQVNLQPAHQAACRAPCSRLRCKTGPVALHACITATAQCRFELANQRCVAGGFATRVAYKGRTMPWMTAHLFAKTYYAPLLARPLDFVRGLRAVFGAGRDWTQDR